MLMIQHSSATISFLLFVLTLILNVINFVSSRAVRLAQNIEEDTLLIGPEWNGNSEFPRIQVTETLVYSVEELDDFKNGESFHERSKNVFLQLISSSQETKLSSSSHSESDKSFILPNVEKRQNRIFSSKNRPDSDTKLYNGETENSSNKNDSDKRLLALTSDDLQNRNRTCLDSLFKYKVRFPGCDPKIITNRFCYGNCISFFIPNMRLQSTRTLGEPALRSCSACMPSEIDLVEVVLKCPRRAQRRLRRTVSRVKNCVCREVGVINSDNGKTKNKTPDEGGEWDNAEE